ncbi:Hsp70 family protein [Paractinoplanes atraurantiacus]|uniref:Hsp70 family protein n=1 Tax=Paractinoplanes atraurantiacus TaxID=1036182 RepID=UPI0015CF05E1|nr:Hsp70 family protein [Actinoplanes atraurantiacus]
MASEYSLGVDLGTTQTAAAVRESDGRIDVVRLGTRRAEIPSLVFVTASGELLIGEAAERRGQAEPDRLAREFKRRVGDPVPILAGGVPFSAHALTGKLLRHVLDTVVRLRGGPPTTITLTHPANWGPYKRDQFDQAVRLADVGPVLFRTEPEAAALRHATARRVGPGETVAVYDLGGGTFDVAVLRREGDDFVLLGEAEGIEQLGGADFDEAVFGHVLEVLGDAAGDLDGDDPEVVTALARLRRDCVEAKEALSFDTETMIPVALPGLHRQVRLNRSELESMIAPALADTIDATRRALRGAGVTPDDLSAILLAGGSSRIPLVAQILTDELSRPVAADPHPEHSVALGAALAGATTPIPARFSGRGGAAPIPTPSTGRGGAAPIPTPSTGRGGAAPISAPSARRGSATPASARPASEPSTLASPAPTSSPASSSSAAPRQAATAAAGVQYARGAASVPGSSDLPDTSEMSVTSGRSETATSPSVAPAPPARTQIFSPPTPSPQTGYSPGPESPGTYPAGSPVGYSAVADPHAAYPAPPVQTPAGPRAPGEPEPGRRRNGRILAITGAFVAVLVAAGTAAYIALNRDDEPEKPDDALPANSAAAVPYPTDKKILVRVDTGADSGPERISKIYAFQPGTDTPRTPLAGTEPGDVLPKWSHDRKQIALTHNTGTASEIYVMNADGSERRKIIDDAPGRVAWSSDDSKLAFVKKVDGVTQLFTMPVAGGPHKQLTFSKDPKDDPFWSADGKAIAYWVQRGGIKQIYELDMADIKEPGRQITTAAMGQANDPALSPDGSQVLFTREGDNGDSDIWIVGRDGENPRQLTDDPSREQDPSWSPDGTWFAFARGPYERPRIVLLKPDGTGEAVVTKSGQREAHPCWF